MSNKNSKKRFKKKHYILLGGALLVALFLIFFNNGNQEKEYVKVEKGTLVQELFETGSTEKGEDVRLSFKEGGEIERIFVSEGDEVNRGEVLASISKRDITISLQEARAVLDSAKASLDRVLRGSLQEDVRVVEAGVRSAEASLEAAKENEKEQKKIAEESLRTAHQGTPTILGDVFSTVKEISIGVDNFADTYFEGVTVPETTSGRRSRDVIRRKTEEVEKYKDFVKKEEVSYEEKENALKETQKELRIIIGEIDNLISVADSDFYKNRVTDASKKELRGYRGTANTALGEITSFIGNISSVDAQISATLSSAKASVNSAQRALEQAEEELARVKADPDSSDVRSAQANVNQAKARVELLENRLNDTNLRSPVKGVISSVFARPGEVVSPGNPVFVIIPEEDLQISVDIYEGDIAKVDTGNSVFANFVAFPGEEFSGEVVFINPAGKLVDGVIYYEIKIMLDEYPEGVLSQMTVDVTIKTEEKENVLMIPERAVYRRGGVSYVSVLENGEIEEKEVKTGIRGEGRMMEIISGLEEGEKVLLD
jgi:RND family efflux transporter MFP subunit